jgi:hypothetical protein
LTLGPRLPPLFRPWPIIKVEAPTIPVPATLYPVPRPTKRHGNLLVMPMATCCSACSFCSASSLPAVAPIPSVQDNISFHDTRLDRGRFFIKLQGLAKIDLGRIMRAPDQGASLLPELREAFSASLSLKHHTPLASRDNTVTLAFLPRDYCANQHSIIAPSRFLLTLRRPYCAPKIDGQCSWQRDQLSNTTL